MDAAFNGYNEHTLSPKTGTDRGVCNTISPEVDLLLNLEFSFFGFLG